MKLQITDVRTGKAEIVEGPDDDAIEGKLRLLYPGPTYHIPEGQLANVIAAVARLQYVALVPLEGALPVPHRIHEHQHEGLPETD